MPHATTTRNNRAAAKKPRRRSAVRAASSDADLCPKQRKSEMEELAEAIRRQRQEEGYPLTFGKGRGRPRRRTVDELRLDYGLAPASAISIPEAGNSTAVAGPPPEQGNASDRMPDLGAIRRSLKLLDAESAAEPSVVYQKTPLQAATAEWLGDVEWNLMVTFTFKGEDGVSLPLATTLFGKFIPRLREIVLRKGSRSRIAMAAVVENSREQLQQVGLEVDGREGTHIHVLLRVRGDDPYKYKDAIEKAWKATNWRCGDPTVYCPNSNKWYLPLTSDEMRKDYTGYVLKHHGTDTLGLLIEYLHLD